LVARSEITKELAGIVSEKWVSTDPEDIIPFSRDNMTWVHGTGMADYAVMPSNTEETQEVVRLANKHKIPITVVTWGTNTTGIAIPRRGGILLIMRRLDKVLEINEDTMTATIEPGVTHGKLIKACLGKSVRPLHIIGCPCGSALAIPFYGVNAFTSRYGSDRIIAIEMVLPNGELIRTGSWANPACEKMNPYNKHGAGPDLAALNYANWAFGAFTKGILRLAPRQEVSDYILVGFHELEPLLRGMQKVEKRDITLGANFVSRGYYARVIAPDVEMLKDPVKLEKFRGSLPPHILQFYVAGTAEQVELYKRLIEQDISQYNGVIMHLTGRMKEKADLQAWGTGISENREFIVPIEETPSWGTIPVVLKMRELMEELYKTNDVRDVVTGLPAEIDYWGQSVERCTQIFYNQSMQFDPRKPETIERARNCYFELFARSIPEGNAMPAFGAQSPEYMRIVNEIKKLVDPNGIWGGILPIEMPF